MGTLVIFAASIVACCIAYWFGYSDGMKMASDDLDAKIEEKFRNSGVVVKKDDRIIECNGMMIPLQCEKCRFGVVKKDEVACCAPDYDGVPVVGLRK